MKIETGTSLFHTPTLLRYNKTLDKSEALETLPTELYVIKDLSVWGLIQKRRGKRPYMSFDLAAEVRRAVRMGSPGNSGHGSKQ